MHLVSPLDPTDAPFQAALVQAIDGQAEGFTYLFRRHHGALLAFLRSQGARDPDDLGSETWIAATRTIKNFAGTEAQFRSWLVTIGRRRLIDSYRRDGRRPRSVELGPHDPVASDPDPAEVAVTRDLTARTLAALDQLSADEAEVIRLRVLADIDTTEVAKMLGRTTTSVRVLQHRAIKKLAAILEAAEQNPRLDSSKSTLPPGNAPSPTTMKEVE